MVTYHPVRRWCKISFTPPGPVLIRTEPPSRHQMNPHTGSPGLAGSAAAGAAVATGTGLGLEVRTRLNTMLHLALTDLDRFFAGNVYRTGPGRGPSGAPSLGPLLKDLLDSQDETRRAQLSGQSVPVLVECTPACDHAQDKIRVAHFIAGVLAPDDQRFTKKMKRGDFIWKFGPMYLEDEVPVASVYNLLPQCAPSHDPRRHCPSAKR